MACDTGHACSSECWNDNKSEDNNINTPGDDG